MISVPPPWCCVDGRIMAIGRAPLGREAGGETAVDYQRGAGNPRGLVGSEVNEAVGDVARRPDTAERGAACGALAGGLGLRLLGQKAVETVGCRPSPGQMQFARMPESAPSSAMHRVNMISPAFEAT